MRIIRKLKRKIKEVGLKNVLIGSLKNVQYRKLIKKYPFNTWHLSPYEWREYAQVCVCYVNAQNAGTVVDIGCGLGGVLQHIKAGKRIGLDLQEEAIMAAREINDETIRFERGSFENLAEKPVDYLITLNFMHGSAETAWRDIYHAAAIRNDVRHFIVDVFPDKPDDPETHSLDWSKILPDNYRRVERFGPFLGEKFVEVWEKR